MTTPLELDVSALDRLLEDASHRALGPRPMLSPSREAEGPRLEGRSTPMMMGTSPPPEPPLLAPPARPRELDTGAPPSLGDPRGQVPEGGSDGAGTPLGEAALERKGARKADLRAKGEIFR